MSLRKKKNYSNDSPKASQSRHSRILSACLEQIAGTPCQTPYGTCRAPRGGSLVEMGRCYQVHLTIQRQAPKVWLMTFGFWLLELI